ncbi:cation:proton antiporter [Paraflavitalea speifideaquila]|uniref:cation:proton antiporter domain-containing protein n=1 Tax=Paraflavitalea speifideaquila TaxID=3076558 RepID=UPI0028E999EE|nr:cation:proton antiporter [Paraflavitalea speifideiaquila]
MQDSFFFQAMLYLASAVIMVPIAKRLGLGSVLGYLIAGIIIGPACLKLIGKEGEDLMHFAEFGVVMMLFVIGLELEPSAFGASVAPSWAWGYAGSAYGHCSGWYYDAV